MDSFGTTNRFRALAKWIPPPPGLLCCHCICGSNKLLMDCWSGTQLHADYWGRRTLGDWRRDWISTFARRESVLQTRPSFQDHMGISNASSHFCPPLVFISALCAGLRCSFYSIRTFIGPIFMSFGSIGQSKNVFWYFICAFPHIFRHVCFEGPAFSVSIIKWSYQRRVFRGINVWMC